MCHSFLTHSSVDGHLDRSHVSWGPEPALDIEQSLPFALWFSLRCQRQRHLPSCWSRGPPSLLLRCVSGLWCKVGRFGGVLLAGRPPSALPLELFTYGCAPLCHISPTVWTLRLHQCWPCSKPHFNCRCDGNWPWCLPDVAFTMPPE